MALLAGNTSMGIGRLGAPNVDFTRRFRFEMSVITPNGTTVPPSFVKTAGLPNISIEPYELNYLNEKMYISGKPTWEPITVTYINAAVPDLFPLWNWIASIYNFTNSSRTMGSRNSDYQGTAIIYLYSSCATLLQSYTLQNCWPESINFGDLDYSSSETVDIAMTLRYSQVSFVSYCPAFTAQAQCSPCGS